MSWSVLLLSVVAVNLLHVQVQEHGAPLVHYQELFVNTVVHEFTYDQLLSFKSYNSLLSYIINKPFYNFNIHVLTKTIIYLLATNWSENYLGFSSCCYLICWYRLQSLLRSTCLGFVNLGLVTPCPKLILVFYVKNRSFNKARKTDERKLGLGRFKVLHSFLV